MPPTLPLSLSTYRRHCDQVTKTQHEHHDIEYIVSFPMVFAQKQAMIYMGHDSIGHGFIIYIIVA